MSTTISIVIPVFNERDNLTELHGQIDLSFDIFDPYYLAEIIFVDDGSSDGSLDVIRHLADIDLRVRFLQLRRNFGKTAALAAGFEAARGEIIVTMDADLQDNPYDLPALLAYLDESGADMVSGWRNKRFANDPLSKTLPSTLYNRVVRLLTGVKLHDFNCGYKVYRREALDGIRLYGDLHRFIPILIDWNGFTVAELPVNHRPRLYGRSKYGAGRLLRGLVDFMMVLFLIRYLKNPLRLFGVAGLLALTIGAVITTYLAALWVGGAAGLIETGAIGTRPLLSGGIFALLFGAQLIAIGLLGEMVRYFGFQPEQEYSVKASNIYEETQCTPTF